MALHRPTAELAVIGEVEEIFQLGRAAQHEEASGGILGRGEADAGHHRAGVRRRTSRGGHRNVLQLQDIQGAGDEVAAGEQEQQAKPENTLQGRA